MKKIISFIICISIALFFINSAMSQDVDIVLNSEGFTKHERPLVTFPHLKHEELILCSRCHHDYDEYRANMENDGGNCSDCHKATSGENPVLLMNAFHRQCKDCHKTLNRRDGKNLPVACGECHIKK